MSGLSFGLGKRPTAGAAAPKKVSVQDLFAGDSSDDDDKSAAQAKKQCLPSASAAVAVSSAASTSVSIDDETRAVADKLADFVAKNGRQFEDMTRDRNPGNTPFSFLHDKQSPAYQHYDAALRKIQGQLAGAAQPDMSSFSGRPAALPPPPVLPSTSDQASEHERRVAAEALAKGNSVAAMDAFMALAARKERQASRPDGTGSGGDDDPPRQKVPLLNATGFDRRKVTAVFKDDGSRGHHMQDFIPPEELAKLLAKGGDAAAAAQAKALENKHAIGADNIGHKLLSKMGWKEGTGVGASGTGITAPITANGTKNESLGLGAEQHGEVSASDDPYEQYRKRMQLGYKHRPNPLGNPRKSYY